MKTMLTENQQALVTAVRSALGSRVDDMSDEQLSLNMGRVRKPEAAVAAIEEWLGHMAAETVEGSQEDVQENDQEDDQETGQDSSQETTAQPESKKKAKKAAKISDPRLRNTYCSVCNANLDITVDEQGHWHLSCPNGDESAARTIPTTTAARMLLGLTWTQYKEVFDQDTSTATARRVAEAAKDGQSQDEIVELLTARKEAVAS